VVTPVRGTVAFSIVRHHFRSARGVGIRAKGCVESGRALAMCETANPGICSDLAFPRQGRPSSLAPSWRSFWSAAEAGALTGTP
jgi:hypothetical protein